MALQPKNKCVGYEGLIERLIKSENFCHSEFIEALMKICTLICLILR